MKFNHLILIATALLTADVVVSECNDQGNFDTCMDISAKAIAQCGTADFKCLCAQQKIKVLCYDRCMDDETLQKVKGSDVGLVTTYCVQVKDDTPPPKNSTTSPPPPPPSKNNGTSKSDNSAAATTHHQLELTLLTTTLIVSYFSA